MRSQSSDLVAGSAAAIGFLAIWGLLGTPYLWLSAALGIALYTGIRLLMAGRKEQGQDQGVADPASWIPKIRTMETQFSDNSIQQQIENLCQVAEVLLADLKARPDSSPEGSFLVGQYLEQAHNGLQLFLGRTRRGAEWSGKAREMLTGLLGTIQDRFEKLHDRVNAQDDAALAGEIKVLTDTLNEVDNVTLNLRAGA